MKTLFHVDDDAFIQQFVSFIFDETDYEIVAFDHGQDLLKKLRTTRPHAVLLDANLEDISGVHLASLVYQADSSIPVIFVSGSDEQDIFRDESRPANVRGLVQKPFAPDDLLELIHSISNEEVYLEKDKNDYLARKKQLREDYITHLISQHDALQKQWQGLQREQAISVDCALLSDFINNMHKIAGACGVYQLSGVHDDARYLEDQLNELQSRGVASSISEFEQISKRFGHMMAEISYLKKNRAGLG